MNISDFTYDLPPERIALYPVERRDQSKLLVYERGQLRHEQFHSITNYLPANAFLFFNDTKVIPARLHFQKDTGAVIEIFLLSPVAPSTLLVQAMEAPHSCTWKCTIGNLKRWTEGKKLIKHFNGITLEAELTDRTAGLVTFSWNEHHVFAEVIRVAGETPLPPYLKRSAEVTDRERYQTIYSHYEGAVAAPTAGLHFTEEVFQALQQKNIQTDFLTLHVSAGTFQPVKTENAADHIMHNEQVVISRRNIENLLVKDRLIIPVGTTSMRTLESLYWYGVKLIQDPDAVFKITQHDPYTTALEKLPSKEMAIQAVSDYINKHGLETLIGETSIYIRPGYSFKICQGLITNFHQPASTLILLVAAFIGTDWRKVYGEALQHNYRFLSYGDSSLLIP